MSTDLASLPRRAMHDGGYVYVVAFDNGVVKPGRTTYPYDRLVQHKSGCRVFGAALTDWWVSPPHDGWKANEQKLIELARQLGGTPAGGAEYFTGISYDQLVEKARALDFPAVQVPETAQPQRGVPAWLKDAISEYGIYIRFGDVSREEAAEHLTDAVFSQDQAFARVIVSRYISRRLAPAAEGAAATP